MASTVSVAAVSRLTPSAVFFFVFLRVFLEKEYKRKINTIFSPRDARYALKKRHPCSVQAPTKAPSCYNNC